LETNIVYFDESGDDGVNTASSKQFILTSLYMKAECWQHNYDVIQKCRKELKEKYGFHSTVEIHASDFLTDKLPYREYQWSFLQRRALLQDYVQCIAQLEAKNINVIIDKTAITTQDYPVLENALKYNIQRIDNDSGGTWNYLIITDKGRIKPMKATARAIRRFNPVPSMFSGESQNLPNKNLIEDILEKDSKESHFIQVCDFISYFVNLYYNLFFRKSVLPNRVANVIEKDFVLFVLDELKKGIFNLKASSFHEYGFVIYPRK